MAGAYKIDVNYGQLLQLLECHTTKTDIACYFNISRPTLDRIITDYELQDLNGELLFVLIQLSAVLACQFQLACFSLRIKKL